MTKRQTVLLFVLGFATPEVFAGDMDSLGYAFVMGFLYLSAIILGSLLAWLACQLIRHRRARTIARWLIVLGFYTPIIQTTPDHHANTVPAFWLLLAGEQWPHWGWPSHPVLLAYAGAFVFSAPVVALWIRLRERHHQRLALASDIQ